MKRPVMVRRRKGSDQEDHQGQIGKEGRGRPTRSLWKWKFFVNFFSKGPTTIEISAKLPIETDIFYEKGDQENHQGQIGEEGTRKQDHYGQSFMYFFLQDCELQKLKKKSKIFIL